MKSSFTRRQLLIASAVTGLATSLAGCTGDEEPSDGNERDTDETEDTDRENHNDTDSTDDEETDNENGGEEDGIEIEYSVSDPQTHDEIPEAVVEHPNPEGFRWIVVEFELIIGSFDADDIMGLTQIDVQGDSHFTRAVEITSPDEELLTSTDDTYMMEQGARGKAYYRVPEDTESGEWIVEQLENQHGDIEVRER